MLPGIKQEVYHAKLTSVISIFAHCAKCFYVDGKSFLELIFHVYVRFFFILQMIKLPVLGVENQSKHNVSLCGGGEAKV